MFALSHARPYLMTVAFTALGCVPPSTPRTNPSDKARQSEEISLAEITTVLRRTSTAADIIRTLRPGMFEPRYPLSAASTNGGRIERAATIQVYIDNIPYGGLETLTTIPAASVRNIRRLSPLDAVTRFGGSHANGVIVVTTGVPDRATR